MKKLLLTIFSLAFFAITASAQSSGNCGSDLSYELSADSVLTITGTGEMYGSAFYKKSNIKSVVIEEGATSIGNSAFSECTSLVSISIPATITSIGSSAFEGCTSLVSISIPSSVTSIDTWVFDDCPKLESINIDEANANYSSSDGVFYNEDKTNLIKYPEGKKDASYSIPSGVTSIGGYAISKCTSLTSITIPASLANIGAFAFSGCSKLKFIKSYATSPAECEATAFYYTTETTPIYVPKANLNTYETTTTGWKYFTNFRAIEDYWCGDDLFYTIADSVLTITGTGEMYDKAFEWREDIKSAVINEGAASIGTLAFSCCSALTSITIPSSATSIGNNAFDDCYELTSINVSDTNANYSSSDGVLFDKDKTELIKYPEGKLGDSYTIPGSVTSIGDYAFYENTYLTSIDIPESVTSIGEGAFSYCELLASITIPSSVTSIGDNAFDESYKLASITVDEANTNYSSADGVLFNKDKTKIIRYPDGKADASYSIPESVTIIGKYAFSDCRLLSSITIPSSVTSIGMCAFSDCGLLASITIPSSVTSIGDYAFENCTALERIISEATSPAECYLSTFEGVTSTIPVYVPQASIDDNAYANAIGWNHFNNFQSIETSVDEPAAEALVVTAQDGTVSVNAEEFAILDLAGVDVTAENGSLSGVYLVKVGTEVVKVMVR